MRKFFRGTTDVEGLEMLRFLAVVTLTAAIAVLGAIHGPETARAATVTDDLILTAVSGPDSGTGLLTVEGFTGIGTETFTNAVGGGLDNLEFFIGGSPFTLSEALGGSASVTFQGDALASIMYEAVGGTLQFLETGGQLQYIFNDFANGSTTSGTISATPLPAAMLLFASGLGLIGLLGWRRKWKTDAGIAAA